VETRRNAIASTDGDRAFDARQNAEIVVGAERYYRAMVGADSNSWNVRDVHMADTLDRLAQHHGPTSRAVVWEHNTHVGDARATPMSGAGLVNVGELVRDRHGGEGVVVVGCSGHRGEVVAALAWGDVERRMPVPPAPPGSHEALLHEAVGAPALLVFPDRRDGPWLAARRGHRAIGVVYEPAHDATANWVPTVMGRRYDALLAFDETAALRPLHREVPVSGVEEEAFPSGQ
jgi:erythromycin esterase